MWATVLLMTLFQVPTGEGNWIDLTHSFDGDTIYWPTAPSFSIKSDFKGHTEGGYYYEANTFTTAEHGGTHLDAPIHFAEGKWTAEQVPLSRLMGPAVVIDVTKACANDRNYRVQVDDFLAWERQHGKLPDGAIVLLNTGFSKYWPDREKYMGTAERGAEAVKKLSFPGLHPDAASWLVANRKIHALGLDTPSIDYGKSTGFESHVILFEANIPAFENVANLHRLPPQGAYVIALPMKIKGGSGGPLRIIARLPQ